MDPGDHMESLRKLLDNLLKNVNSEAGLVSWYFNHSPKSFNLRRAVGRTSFAVSRRLGNLGVSSSTPLLERFGDARPMNAARSVTARIKSSRVLEA
jgi:hypothetical protein